MKLAIMVAALTSIADEIKPLKLVGVSLSDGSLARRAALIRTDRSRAAAVLPNV